MLLVGCGTGARIDPDTTGSTDGVTTELPTGGSGTETDPSSPPSTELPPGTVMPFETVEPGSGTGLTIGLISSAGTDPFDLAVTDSVVAQVDAAGAELIRCDPGDDAALVLDCARRLAVQQVDGWIVLQPDDLGDALCDAGPADVPLIAVGSAPIGCQTAMVGADDRQAGELVGAGLGRSSQSAAGCAVDTLVIVTTDVTDVVGGLRADGIRAGFAAACPDAEPTEVELDVGTQDRAYDEFTTLLTSIPGDENVLVAATNDGPALGVLAAIPDTWAGTVTLAAVGLDQRARCEVAANPRWTGDAALFPDRYGEVVVPALLDAIGGTPIPLNMYVQSIFVTAQTAGVYYDTTDCPAG